MAHECGHIFLHNEGAGYWLPGHVKELEAETYAHQAFREHGMELPKVLSDWGRSYVGSWIDKDRAAGIAIDPRAEAYACGARSPYEPLRMVPATWTLHAALPTIEEQHASWPDLDVLPNAQPWRPSWRDEARLLLARVGFAALVAPTVLHVGLKFVNLWHPLPTLYRGPMADPTPAMMWLMIVTALAAANAVALHRTMTRMQPRAERQRRSE